MMLKIHVHLKGTMIIMHNSGQLQFWPKLCGHLRKNTHAAPFREEIAPPPPNNVGAMIHISWCLFNIVGHNIVQGVRGMKEIIVCFAFKYENLVKYYCPHSFCPGL